MLVRSVQLPDATKTFPNDYLKILENTEPLFDSKWVFSNIMSNKSQYNDMLGTPKDQWGE